MHPLRSSILNLTLVFTVLPGLPADLLAQELPAERSRAITEYESIPATIAKIPSAITSFALTADEQRFAIGDEDGRIRLYQRSPTRLLNVVSAHQDSVSSLTFSADGNQLASGSFDHTVKIWNTSDLAPLKTLTGYEGPVTGLRFSSDGTKLTTAGYDKTIRKWNLVSNNSDAELVSKHDDTIRNFAISRDDQWLASVSGQNLNLYKSRNSNRTITASENLIDVAFGRSGQHVATVDAKGTAQVYETVSGKSVRRHVSVGQGWAIAIDDGSRQVAVGKRNGAVTLWPNKDAMSVELEGHNDAVSAIRFCRTDNSVLTSSYDGRVLEWRSRLPAHEPIARVETTFRIWDCAFSPDQKSIAVAGKAGAVEIRDLRTGQTTQSFKAHTVTIDRITFSPDNQTLAVAGWSSNDVHVVDATDGQRIHNCKVDSKARTVAFSPAGSSLAVGCTDRQIVLFNSDSGDRLSAVTGHKLKVYDIAWMPDGESLVTCDGNWSKSEPGTVKIWEAGSLVEIGKLNGHATGVGAVAIRADGKELASASRAGRIKIWDVSSRTQIVNLGIADGTDSTDASRIRDIEYSPDGKLIAAAMYDGTINIWNVAERKIAYRLRGDDDTFTVHFSIDGSVLSAATGKKHVLFWDLPNLVPGATATQVRQWKTTQPQSSTGSIQ